MMLPCIYDRAFSQIHTRALIGLDYIGLSPIFEFSEMVKIIFFYLIPNLVYS